MPVIAAVELEDGISLRERASQSHRTHRRFGSTRDEPHHLDVGHTRPYQLRQPNFQSGWHAEARAVSHCLFECIEYDRRGVTEYERAPRQNEIDVFVAVHVPDPRAFSTFRNDRIAANAAKRAYRRIDAAGAQLARASHYLLRAFSCL